MAHFSLWKREKFWSWREILPSTRCMGVSLKFLRSNSRRQRMRRGWRDISAPGRSKESALRWRRGLRNDSGRIRFGLSKKSRSAWRRSRGSASARRWILHPRWKKSTKCGKQWSICRNTGFPTRWRCGFMKPTAAGSIGFWKKTRTSLRMILTESASARRMNSPQESASTRIRIFGFGAEFCIHYCRRPEKGTCICRAAF